MKILHIAPSDKFIQSFVDFVDENLDISDHEFVIFGKESPIPIEERKNILKFRKKTSLFNPVKQFILLKAMWKSERIIIHGLFSFYFIILLLIFPFHRKKCYWLIWGGDLYIKETSKINLKTKIRELIKKVVVKEIGFIVTSIRGDYERAVKWYGARGKHLPIFAYPASLYHDLTAPVRKSEKINLLIGNSATPSNNHFEVFHQIKSIISKDVNVICPLNYGDKTYAEKVIRLGKELFGEAFKAITDFMPYEEYMHLLSTIDIAIFHHNRQQGMSNIRVLLGMGKKVYLREGISSSDDLTSLGIKLYRLKEFSLEIDYASAKKNSSIIKKNYSIDKLKNNLELIFYG